MDAKDQGPTPPTSRGEAASAEETWAAGDAGPASLDTSAELAPGVALGRYVVLRTIGHGGMGVVYQAYDPQLDRSVAVKLLLGSEGPSGTNGRQRLVREAQAMASIAHPNVIAVHDVGTIGEQVFFAMEYVDGKELRAWLAAAPRDVDTILDVFAQAGAGMAAAHEAGLVHRDFKPGNVLVDQRGRARVLDFGLAQRGVNAAISAAERAGGHQNPMGIDLTATGALMGTPAYMAPEQFNGEATDERSDQFSFCVALYEALIGQRPFEGDTLPALTASVITGVRRVHERPDAVPPAVWAATQRGLSQDRAERFESMDALLAALRQRPQSRRTLGWGAGIVACGAAALVWTQRAGEPEPCVDAGTGIAEDWGDAEHQGLSRAFAATGKPYAADTAERVELRLDVYASRWREAGRLACEMTRVRQQRSEALYAKAEACLEERRNAFVHVVEELTSIAPEGVLDSLKKTLALPELAECSDRNLLEVRVAAPEDPDVRAKVVAIAQARQSAAAALKRGDAQGCIGTIEGLMPAVEAAAHPPSLSATQFLHAGCLHGAGEAAAADVMELRAFESALAAADDLTAIKVSSSMAHRLAVSTEDLDAAEAWLLRAEALQRRHGLDAPHLIAPSLNVRGVLLARRGDTDAAVATFLELGRITDGVEGLEQAHLSGMQNAGVALANAGKRDEAREIFEGVLRQSRVLWGPNHPQVARATSVLAKLRLKEGATAEAAELLESSLNITRQHATPYDLGLAYDLHALGLAKRQLGKSDEALVLYEQALDQRETANAAETVEASEMMTGLARLYLDGGRAKEGRALLERVRDIRDRVGATACERGEAYAALAELAAKSGEVENAVAWGRLGLSLGREDAGTDRASCGDVLLRVAGALELVGEPDTLAIFAEGYARVVAEDKEALALEGMLNYARALHAEKQNGKAAAIAERVEELATTDDRETTLAEARALLLSIEN